MRLFWMFLNFCATCTEISVCLRIRFTVDLNWYLVNGEISVDRSSSIVFRSNVLLLPQPVPHRKHIANETAICVNPPIHSFTEDAKNLTDPQSTNNSACYGKGKGKAVPLQAWSGPESSRKLKFPDFMTTAQDGGKVCQPYTPAAFTPRKYTSYSFLLEADSTPGP